MSPDNDESARLMSGSDQNAANVQENFSLKQEDMSRYCRVSCLLCISTILSIILAAGVGVAITLPFLNPHKKERSLLDMSNVTQGETYLVPARDCTLLTLTVAPEPYSLSGKLDSLSHTPVLSDTSVMKVSYDDIVSEDAVISDWMFYIYPGSTLNRTSCALLTSGCLDTKNARYAFIIIQGADNYAKWLVDRSVTHTANYSQLTAGNACVNNTDNGSYNYSVEGDYYHVFLTSASVGCNISVSANATFVRTEYHNSVDTSCPVDKQKRSCSKPSLSELYAFVAIDEINGVEIDWTEQISFSLTCQHDSRPCVECYGPLVAIVLFFAFILIAWPLVYVYHRKEVGSAKELVDAEGESEISGLPDM